ncbi:MAG TPA: ATP synthase F1 subunit delta [Candidatus Magasanikbacteria bacterium]|nr:MAG: ATP synthase F1 subunit delta [Candidatus Magasanikbacteria bacterium RIFCSPLOWO2_02_FULL_47_16]OGH79904.1 MAG: ATP synthase F1 subunit delta [Candidatus Magasanikbacteria bacterium RIFCSPHIGHO2_02_FULL_48_18]OGH83260.1 MAG: ATP synthase F1 subunit delta [Candidatus Magasanikbacteria bacterium RIFCSPLOWO2_12_FULL_47_9b]HAZ28621.1 ATP synthase F1 subunit delta [Candidatus Magasanikbacteria bacterium]
MKKRSHTQYAEALYEMTKDIAGKELDAVLRAFVHILARDRQLLHVDKIVDSFLRHVKKQEGIQDLHIETARTLDPKTRAAIAAACGKKTDVTTSVRPGLLGGFRITTEHTILDASVAAQLKRLEATLIS